ncbi:tail assembly chaperone E/41/14-like protein [Nicoletella semolina]|uniref:Tail assembly chaperone E/41/14-like protein n=1 Tax=Nicoletella semolina TaxID=271160 RepID=A0A4R2N8L6_9PAST|nr:phage tail assembly protein [Nicoletella semolina]MDH2924547.1 phage tail protein [Nicoletella semolina]TCP17324.1 tail assembly chaperone E/41/14-like protein [Nicoletella semolina]
MAEKLDDLLIFKTIALNYPIKDGQGNEITELKIRRAKAKDFRQTMQGNSVEGEMRLLARLTGLVPEDIDELDISDYLNAQKVLVEIQEGK